VNILGNPWMLFIFFVLLSSLALLLLLVRGAPVMQICPHCGRFIEPKNDRCPACGGAQWLG
jgi:hypothetical protein